jgi:polysaccharide biosynthesis protein PslG
VLRALLGLAVLVPLLAAAPAQAKRQVPVGWLGVNGDGPIMNDAGGPPDSEWSFMATSGVEGVRLAVRWSAMQASRDAAIDFSGADQLVLGAARHGIPILPVVQDTPAWAARRPGRAMASPPRDPADAAAFVTALVRRWGPGGSLWAEHPEIGAVPVRDWQVYNEPNLPSFWSQRPFAPSYVRLLRSVHRAIHRADPHARTVLAGLPNRSWAALRALYHAGAHGAFDVLSLNVFTRRPRDMVRIAQLVRREMRRHGDRRKPIWLTEMGWPASRGRIAPAPPFATTDRGQRTNLRRGILALAAARRRLGIGRVYWYTWMSQQGVSSVFQWSGLRRIRHGAVSNAPSLMAFRVVARRLEGCAKRTGDATLCR